MCIRDRYHVTVSSIASDIAAADLAYPAGDTKVGDQSLSVTTSESYDTVESLNQICLLYTSKRLEDWMRRTDDPILKYGSRVPKPAGARVNRLSCVNPRLLDFEE